jgi:tRNA(Ile)-lysidine synthase
MTTGVALTPGRNPGWADLMRQLDACLKRHLKPASEAGNIGATSRLCVAYSGGLDSSVLLHLLAEARQSLGFSLTAVHVHHGLSNQADAWVRHCTQVCLALDVPLAIHHVDVQLAGEGLEAAARAARYRVFGQLDADFLVLAHHRDDQAETVLLQLLRGASLKGLAAMPEVRPLTEKLKLLRPLLAATRAEIAAGAAASGLAWVDDASNGDLRLARNALRQEVFPRLIRHFPHAPKALAQAAAQFSEAALLLDALADQDGCTAISQNGLAIPALQALSESRARNLLRRFLERAGVEIHAEAVREALRQLCGARPDAQICIEFGQYVLRRYRGWAVVEAALPEVAQNSTSVLIWQGEKRIDLGAAGSLQFQSVPGEGVRLAPGVVSIRTRQGGERIKPGPGRPRRTLKNLLREAGVPAWQRGAMPLVYLADSLVWAAGVGADSDFLAKPEEAGWLISWQLNPSSVRLNKAA